MLGRKIKKKTNAGDARRIISFLKTISDLRLRNENLNFCKVYQVDTCRKEQIEKKRRNECQVEKMHEHAQNRSFLLVFAMCDQVTSFIGLKW